MMMPLFVEEDLRRMSREDLVKLLMKVQQLMLVQDDMLDAYKKGLDNIGEALGGG